MYSIDSAGILDEKCHWVQHGEKGNQRPGHNPPDTVVLFTGLFLMTLILCCVEV